MKIGSPARQTCYLQNFNSRVVTMCALGKEVNFWYFWHGTLKYIKGRGDAKRQLQSAVGLVSCRWSERQQIREVYVHVRSKSNTLKLNTRSIFFLAYFQAFCYIICRQSCFSRPRSDLSYLRELPLSLSFCEDSRHLTLPLPPLRHRPMCATQKVESTPRCHGSGRAESCDFTHQWPQSVALPVPGNRRPQYVMGNSGTFGGVKSYRSLQWLEPAP